MEMAGSRSLLSVLQEAGMCGEVMLGRGYRSPRPACPALPSQLVLDLIKLKELR